MRSARPLSWLVALSLIGALATCSPVTGSDDNGLTFRTLETPNFLLYYTAADAATIDTFVADMNAKLTRLKAKFGVDSMPVLTIVLYPDLRSFQRVNPSGLATGVTRGTSRMEIVSPYGPNQVVDLWPDTRAEHMLTHLVTLAVNSTITNNPRWLWESIALYESGQKTIVTDIEFFAPNAEPALSQLNDRLSDRATSDGGGPIIDVGYYLGEFMDATFGPEVVVELLESKGDLETTLGLTDEEFITRFIAFVRAKYGV